MPVFPSEDSDVVELARKVAKGIAENHKLYPLPPIGPDDLRLSADNFIKAREREIAAKRNLEDASRQREQLLEELVEKTKLNVNYAESTVDYDDDQLRKLGWRGRKPQRLLPPGAPRVLEVVRIQDGAVELDWKKPSDGGDPQSYRIEAMAEGDERYSLKGFSLHSDTVLTNFAPGKKYQVRVIAVNKIGDSQPSDIIDVFVD